MAQFKIKVECFLGMSHCGSVSVDNEGTVELSDNDVATLVSLIREKKTDDIEELELENKYPEIYKKLFEAHAEIADTIVDDHWYWEIFCSGDIGYDVEKLMDYCKDHHGFVSQSDRLWQLDDEEEIEDEDYEDDEADYEYDKEKEIDEFLDWFHDLMGDLSLAERNEIFTGPLAMELNDYGASPDEFEVKIPTEIVGMAK